MDNPEIQSVVEQIDVAIDLHETQIAYAIGGRYFTIQHTDEGFDYTFTAGITGSWTEEFMTIRI